MTVGDFLCRGYYLASFNGSPPQRTCCVEKHITIGVSFALTVKGRSHAMNMPTNVAPRQGTFRELLHLWKFQNLPQLSLLMACLFMTTAAVNAEPQCTQPNLN